MTTDAHSEPTAHEVHPHAGHDDQHHWSDLQYIQLALALAVITALEVVLSYTKDEFGAFFLPLLLIMMAIKFFAVVFYFMHVKYSSKLVQLAAVGAQQALVNALLGEDVLEGIFQVGFAHL